MKLTLLLLVLVPAVSARCGGGGGGSAGVRDQVGPLSEISFPVERGLTDADVVPVLGSASDASGVTSVDVNGNAATSSDGFAHWFAEVAPTDGLTTLDVEATDQRGNRRGVLAQRQFESTSRLLAAPIQLDFDASRGSLLVVDAIENSLVELSVKDGARSVLSDAYAGGGDPFDRVVGVAADAANGRAFVAEKGPTRLVVVDLTKGSRSEFSSATVGGGPLPLIGGDVVLDEKRGRLLWLEPLASHPAIYAVDLATGDREILSDDAKGGGPAFGTPVGLSLDTGDDRLFVIDATLAALFEVDPVDGDRKIVSDAATGSGPIWFDARDVAVPSGTGTACVLAPGARGMEVIEVDLANGDRTVLSGIFEGAGLLLQAPKALACDGGQFLYAIDDLAGAAIAIDRATGDRTELVARAFVGVGIPLFDADLVELDPAAGAAFVGTAGTGNPIRSIVQFELVLGERRVVAGFGGATGDSFTSVDGLALDAEDQKLFFVDGSVDAAVLVVDLAAEVVTQLSSATRGSGPQLEGLTSVEIDDRRGRLLVGNNDFDPVFPSIDASVLAIDPETGDRTLLSGLGKGSGFSFNSVSAMDYDAESDRLVVLDSSSFALVDVDLETSARTIVSSSRSSNKIGSGPSLSGARSVALDAAHGRAFVSATLFPEGEVILVIDLATGDRAILSSLASAPRRQGPALQSVAGIACDPARDLVYVADRRFEALLVVDATTGERMVVAR